MNINKQHEMNAVFISFLFQKAIKRHNAAPLN